MNDKQHSDEKFLESVRRKLDASEQSLTADELRALRLARARAIESVERPRGLGLVTGAMVTAATLVAIVIGLQVPLVDNVERPYEIGANAIEDMQLLSASEELEFYENLEFYQWLEFEDRQG